MTKTARLYDFATTLLNDRHFTRVYLRLPASASVFANSRARQIRTSKHTADAFGLDCLGNVTVLWADGRCQQLITDAEIKASGLFR